MSSFDHIDFNLKLADIELASFKSWLAAVRFVGESEIVAEIKSRPHMTCLLASTLGLPAPDMIKF